MKRIILFFLVIPVTGTFSFAQNVGINATSVLPAPSAMLDVVAANKGVLLPRVGLSGITDVTTVPSPANSLLLYNTATAGTAPGNVTPGYYYWENAKWNRLGTAAGSLIAFSSGIVRSGATVVSAAPVLLGMGNSTVEVINFSGESTSPPEAGGFSFVVPYNGVIQNLQVSTDLLAASQVSINTLGLQYDFTVFVSPSSPNNGTDHAALPYLTRPLTSSVRFGFPNTIINAGTFRSATNINTGSIVVSAGDRIGIRVRTLQSTDASASDITQLSFSASLIYTPAQ
jgi:hypothetical protein